MNGVWRMPEWEAATAALEKLQSEKNKSSDNNSSVKSTSATGASVTTAQNTMSYANAAFYSQYYAAYQNPYAAYGMYGFGPYSQYGLYANMPFAGPTPQQMQPPPPPPPSAKNEPKSESSDVQSQAVSSTAVSVSAVTTSCNSDSTAKAGNETTAATASTTQSTWPKASSADSANTGYSYAGSSWQPSVGMASSAAGMWPQFPNTPRPKSSGAAGFHSARTPASVGSGSWQHSAMSAGDTGRFSAGAMRPSRPSASPAMPSLRWSTSPRVNPYDGTFRQAVPKHSSELYSPYDPTQSEECENQPTDSQNFGGFTQVPDAGNIRFRMPNRGACRPMQWRQQSPRPRFSPEMQSPQHGPMQCSPNWRFGQYSAQQQASQPARVNAGVRPIIMPRTKNHMARARSPWNASTDMQKVPDSVQKPSELHESRWDKDETVANTADTAKSAAAESEALNPTSAEEWPTSLKQYVHRCFSSVKDDRDKDVMEAKLKQMLTSSFGDGTALTRDWDHESVPKIQNSSSPSFLSLDSPLASDRYGRSPRNLCSPRNFKFAGSLRGRRRGTPSSGSQQSRGWSPPGFRRRSRSRSHSRKSRSRSTSRSSSSSRHSSRSRRRRHRRRRDSR